MDQTNGTVEQWLKELEARLNALEAASKKLDRLVDKLFKRLPRKPAPVANEVLKKTA